MYRSLVDEDIIYWIDQMGYEIINEKEVLNYIKENFIRTHREVVEEFIIAMEIKIPDIFLLDWEAICRQDNDYEELENGKYLNRYLFEEESSELKRLNLIA